MELHFQCVDFSDWEPKKQSFVTVQNIFITVDYVIIAGKKTYDIFNHFIFTTTFFSVKIIKFRPEIHKSFFTDIPQIKIISWGKYHFSLFHLCRRFWRNKSHNIFSSIFSFRVRHTALQGKTRKIEYQYLPSMFSAPTEQIIWCWLWYFVQNPN